MVKKVRRSRGRVRKCGNEKVQKSLKVCTCSCWKIMSAFYLSLTSGLPWLSPVRLGSELSHSPSDSIIYAWWLVCLVLYE